jgi:hypothetical protein
MMKRIFYMFFLFVGFNSCTKEKEVAQVQPDIPVIFSSSYKYCYSNTEGQFTFEVQENKTVKYYVLDGGNNTNSVKNNKITEITSQKINGLKTYQFLFPKKSLPFHFQVHAIHENKLINSSPILTFK